MCGIIAYTGAQALIPTLIAGLKRLEYRGYDSSGVCYAEAGILHTIRAVGNISALEKKLQTLPRVDAKAGIGHTRWATHGAPTEENAHPHISYDGTVALVHNGIIENHEVIKAQLEKQNIPFISQTDSEVLVNAIAMALHDTPDMLTALASALRSTIGSYAIAVVCAHEPDVIYAAKRSAPLIIGVGKAEFFVASDIPAFLAHTNKVIYLEDDDIVRLTPSSLEIYTMDDLQAVKRDTTTITWNTQAAEKNGYPHFMLKEINEQPSIIAAGLQQATNTEGNTILLPELDSITVPQRLRIIACGTSFHAGLWARPLFESWAGIPTDVEIATEFRYRNPIIGSHETLLFISQSGETADLLAALEIAKQQQCSNILSICNVAGSTLTRESAATIYSQAGPEVSVASTKAFTSQMLLLTLMALYWGQKKKQLTSEALQEQVEALRALPNLLSDALPALQEEAKRLAVFLAPYEHLFVLGRGQSYPLALEGALKIKETTYLHAEGYSLGELKHGPIALVDTNFPCLAFAPHDELFVKNKANLEEIHARDGKVIAITNPALQKIHEIAAEQVWTVPFITEPFASFLMIPAVQLLSYELACHKGNDVDKPRNLAKSVTVE